MQWHDWYVGQAVVVLDRCVVARVAGVVAWVADVVARVAGVVTRVPGVVARVVVVAVAVLVVATVVVREDVEILTRLHTHTMQPLFFFSTAFRLLPVLLAFFAHFFSHLRGETMVQAAEVVVGGKVVDGRVTEGMVACVLCELAVVVAATVV